jgi:hypothetical protein
LKCERVFEISVAMRLNASIVFGLAIASLSLAQTTSIFLPAEYAETFTGYVIGSVGAWNTDINIVE